jgi:hypothetical protein
MREDLNFRVSRVALALAGGDSLHDGAGIRKCGSRMRSGAFA